ncbi:MAG: flagellar protein FlaG [Candidatus Accumulibacter sp.]|uniref:flagellar protein FlaG n=1 Tax=Accumulibacter sp. TaxID=2053492 RepID=UPI00287B2B82|nr:flagellar protein FlaG [Accumulibacter sp.]MDS4013412.1 flagellar protein FlaG [Accumulibacter sp.]
MNVPPAVASAGSANIRPDIELRPAQPGKTVESLDAKVRAVTSENAAQRLEPTRSEVTEAVSQIKEFVAQSGKEINFSIDEQSGIRVVKVLDTATNEVVRQIPSEEVVAIARALDKLQGLFLRDKA